MLPAAFIPEGFQGGLTVIRTILQVKVRAEADNSNCFGAVGVTVSTRDALAALAMPEPITDLVDWYYLTSYWVNQESERSATAIAEIDLRSARRIRGEDRTLVMVIQANPGSEASLQVSPMARMLLRRS